MDGSPSSPHCPGRGHQLEKKAYLMIFGSGTFDVVLAAPLVAHEGLHDGEVRQAGRLHEFVQDPP